MSALNAVFLHEWTAERHSQYAALVVGEKKGELELKHK